MSDPAAIALVHRVHPHEDFNRTAQILLVLLNKAQREHPGKKRCLHLEIDGHRDSKGDFDFDMMELQSKFMADFMLQFLTRAELPLCVIQNPNPQINEIPDNLSLINIDRPPSDGTDKFKPTPRF
jgi:hypothetical protein